MQSENIAELAAALAKAQAVITSPPKNRAVKVRMKSGGTYDFAYTTLDAGIEHVREALTKNGLWFVQTTDVHVDVADRVNPLLTTMLVHSSGQWISGTLPFNLSVNPQETGSHLTYMKRYGLFSILGLAAEEDDDGNVAAGNEAKVEERIKPPEPAPISSEPHTIPYAEGHELDWGSKLIGAINSATTEAQFGAWLTANEDNYLKVEKVAPNVTKRVTQRITQARRKLIDNEASAPLKEAA